jgi:hypothetical protein
VAAGRALSAGGIGSFEAPPPDAALIADWRAEADLVVFALRGESTGAVGRAVVGSAAALPGAGSTGALAVPAEAPASGLSDGWPG